MHAIPAIYSRETEYIDFLVVDNLPINVITGLFTVKNIRTHLAFEKDIAGKRIGNEKIKLGRRFAYRDDSDDDGGTN